MAAVILFGLIGVVLCHYGPESPSPGTSLLSFLGLSGTIVDDSPVVVIGLVEQRLSEAAAPLPKR